jgi:hypothetical protein
MGKPIGLFEVDQPTGGLFLKLKAVCLVGQCPKGGERPNKSKQVEWLLLVRLMGL